MNNENKTTLQLIKEQLEGKMKRAIEKAIKAGAEIKMSISDATINGATVDGIYIVKEQYKEGHAVVLYFRSEEIDEIFKSTKEQMQKRAESLREELERIENQLKEDKK